MLARRWPAHQFSSAPRLEQVVLHDVANDAELVEVAPAVADPDRLLRRAASRASERLQHGEGEHAFRARLTLNVIITFATLCRFLTGTPGGKGRVGDPRGLEISRLGGENTRLPCPQNAAAHQSGEKTWFERRSTRIFSTSSFPR